MHIHILGICGTFMGGLAIIARQLGYKVTGSDANVYPPMSTQLEAQGIGLIEGFDPSQLEPKPDVVVIGNAMSRGNPVVEAVLDQGLPYVSGPQWLAEHLLKDRWVLACAGTHGKTTTSSMLTWILSFAGMKPGFLIGGVPQNFSISADIGDSAFFVIEADEYDSAFFDKRSKFVHYRPRTLVLNNLEFDHADIFSDLAAIQRQFHHLLRTVPGTGLVILPEDDVNLDAVLDQGCWSERCYTSLSKPLADGWSSQLISSDGSAFKVFFQGQLVAEVNWSQVGDHNVSNALSAMAAARHVGVEPAIAAEALNSFLGVKRRMECLGTVNGVTVFDDFAHHPTAISTTLRGLREKVGRKKITAVIEPRSNTMRMGVHLSRLADAAAEADRVMWYQPEGLDWSLASVIANSNNDAALYSHTSAIIEELVATAEVGEQIVIMSNGGFAGIHQQLITALKQPK